MPSKSKAQHRFMAACASGAKIDKKCPPKSVAREYVHADKGKVKEMPERKKK